MKRLIVFFVLVLVLNSSYGKIEITTDKPDTIIGLSGSDFSFYGIHLGMSKSSVKSLLKKQKHLSFRPGSDKYSDTIEISRSDINWKQFGHNKTHQVRRGWEHNYDSLVVFDNDEQVVSFSILFTFSDIISESFSDIRFLRYHDRRFSDDDYKNKQIREFIGYPLFWYMKDIYYEEQYTWGKLVFDEGIQIIFHHRLRDNS